jgi:Zn-dependent M28 family amino/carboxypeptidase
MLTGHHDAFFSGADDNSSAVAVLLEAARTLRDSHPDRTIRILAFDLEEYGLIGAVRHLAAHHQDRIVMVLNMDCVGFASHARGSQRLLPGLQVSDTGDFLGVFANAISATAVERLLRVAPSLQNTPPLVAGVGSGDLHSVGESPFLRSDHSPFWSAGIPALFFTDTAEFRNPNYHKVTDTVDTLDFDFLTGATRVIVAATAAYATVD